MLRIIGTRAGVVVRAVVPRWSSRGMAIKPSLLIAAGKSGAGKQPRIDVLTETFGLDQLSTGNIFRSYLGAWSAIRNAVPEGERPAWFNVAETTGVPDMDEVTKVLKAQCEKAGVEMDRAMLGFRAALYVERGQFVPDDITNDLFNSAFGEHGGKNLVLDGYPRTSDQVEFLLKACKEHDVKIDGILVVDGDDDHITGRAVGRRICPKSNCGKVYHITDKPPADGNLCKACGTGVVHRSDDTEENIRKRLSEFHDKAQPAIDLLKKNGIPVAHVTGNLEVFTKENVKNTVFDAIRPIGLVD